MAIDRDRLLEIFGEELEDRRRDLEQGLLALEEGPETSERAGMVTELFRAAHSLKGAAHSAGITAIAEVAHQLEDLFVQLRDNDLAVDGDQWRTAFAKLDELDALASASLPGNPVAQGARGAAEEGGPRAAAPAAAQGAGLRTRIASTDLDATVAAAGELHVAVSRGGDLVRAAAQLAADVGALERELRARAGASAAPGADASATEAEDTVQRLEEAAVDLERRTAAHDLDLTRAAASVRRAVHGLGLVAFEDVCGGLDRVVRDVATASGKAARLEVQAGAQKLDRSVAAVLRDPLVHLVRNAVDHGIELPDVRTRQGKDPTGQVVITASPQQGELVVTVTDDGGGIDVDAVRAAAARLGLPEPADDAAAAALLLEPGFSTAPRTTEISGRGVGLDAVRSAVESAGGSLELDARRSGTAIELHLPLTLSTMRVVLVRVADEVVALPVTSVERARRHVPDALAEVGGRPVLVLEDRSVAFADLAAVLGFGRTAPAHGASVVLVLRGGTDDAAVLVDAVLDEQEVWVRPLPPRLAGLGGVLGGAMTGDGRSVLLLSPSTWVRAVQRGGHAAVAREDVAEARRTRIVLAEDTATTRMLEQSILEAAGYEVLAAPDGQEAWRLLEQHGADLVVSDVDMPNLDGFDLCRRVRSSPRFGDVPVVLVTSLGDEADRARGLEAGADAYFVKSSFDQGSLIDTIARLL